MVRSNSSSVITREHALTGEKLSLLAVFAHPEDESFGPAGTLSKYASEGVEVSLVTATRGHHHTSRESASVSIEDTAVPTRDRLCSCRASGIRRVCLLDCNPGELAQLDPEFIEERLVRLIREIQPQVIVTFGPNGLVGDDDNKIINNAATLAFRDAGDSSKFPQHFHEELGAYASQKLYYCVLPESLIDQWGLPGFFAVPDNQITAVLDVSSYSEAMRNALYCQRSHALDFIRWLLEEQRVEWDSEYYTLIESRLNRKPRREKDLFAGLR